MRTLRDLLTTWEVWSERAVNGRALATAHTDEQRIVMRRALAEGFDVDPLDVLRDMTELVSRFCGWRWQVMHAARTAGSSWEDIGAALGVTAEDAKGGFGGALDQLDRVRPGQSALYRDLL